MNLNLKSRLSLPAFPPQSVKIQSFTHASKLYAISYKLKKKLLHLSSQSLRDSFPKGRAKRLQIIEVLRLLSPNLGEVPEGRRGLVQQFPISFFYYIIPTQCNTRNSDDRCCCG